jgi:hypothetical protein
VDMIQFEVRGFVQQYSFYFNLDIFRYLLHVFMQQNRSESLFMEGVENERYENYQSGEYQQYLQNLQIARTRRN